MRMVRFRAEASGWATATRSALAAHSESLQQARAHVLGLDVSVRCTGIAVLSADGNLVSSNVVLSKPTLASVLSAGAMVAQSLRDQLARLDGPVVESGVEDFAMQYREASSSALARFTLARINGIAAYETWVQTGSGVVFHYPSTMRSYFGIGVKRDKSQDAEEKEGSGKGKAKAKKAMRASTKSAVLHHVLQVFPGFEDHVSSFEAHEAQRVPIETAIRVGGARTEPTNSRVRDTQFDRADAVLTAMYTLASSLELRALSQDGGQLFARLAHEVLPSARLGRSTVADADIPVVQGALVRMHAQELKREARARAPYISSCSFSEGEEDRDGPDRAAPRKVKGKGKRDLSLRPSVPLSSMAALDEAALSRLYWRLRGTFTEVCKETLLDDVLGWRARARGRAAHESAHGSRLQ